VIPWCTFRPSWAADAHTLLRYAYVQMEPIADLLRVL
jgi:hypothetical protein